MSGAGSWYQFGAQRQDSLLLVLHRKLIRAPDYGENSKYWAAEALDWDSVYPQNSSLVGS
jgi:hypothetical protein